MKKVWLIKVTTGRYSDAISWIIRAYSTSKQADAELTDPCEDAGEI